MSEAMPGAQDGDTIVQVEMTVTREFRMNVSKVERDFARELAADQADGRTVNQFLRESFFELCGGDGPQDHIDGSYVVLDTDETEVIAPGWLTHD